MYTVHFYAGTHGKWLRDRTDEAIKSGIPVFISESAGMEATGDGKFNYPEWHSYFSWMNKIS
jgi:endoglucanase